MPQGHVVRGAVGFVISLRKTSPAQRASRISATSGGPTRARRGWCPVPRAYAAARDRNVNRSGSTIRREYGAIVDLASAGGRAAACPPTRSCAVSGGHRAVAGGARQRCVRDGGLHLDPHAARTVGVPAGVPRRDAGLTVRAAVGHIRQRAARASYGNAHSRAPRSAT